MLHQYLKRAAAVPATPGTNRFCTTSTASSHPESPTPAQRQLARLQPAPAPRFRQRPWPRPRTRPHTPRQRPRLRRHPHRHPPAASSACRCPSCQAGSAGRRSRPHPAPPAGSSTCSVCVRGGAGRGRERGRAAHGVGRRVRGGHGSVQVWSVGVALLGRTSELPTRAACPRAGAQGHPARLRPPTWISLRFLARFSSLRASSACAGRQGRPEPGPASGVCTRPCAAPRHAQLTPS